MRKLTTFLRRVASGSFKRFFRNLDIVHKESGKNRLWLFFSMVFCMFYYGIGYLDYMTFGFAYIKKDKRSTFMTMNDNLSLARRLNNPEANPTFKDKLNFNRTFKEYLKRDFVDLQSGFEAFEKFCQGKTCFFAKEPDSFGGLGVMKVNLEGKDLREIYNELISKKLFLAEEAIIQHEEMNRLCERSVNTIRIVTVLSDKGNANFVYALIRVGSGKNDVDNVTSGGMYTLLSENGEITHPLFCDKTVSYYTEHPYYKVPFIGFKVPYFKEALELCKNAAKVEPRMRYVGWDVAITPKGPVLVEGNNLPGYDMCQNHRFHDLGEGMKKAFEFAEKN